MLQAMSSLQIILAWSSPYVVCLISGFFIATKSASLSSYVFQSSNFFGNI